MKQYLHLLEHVYENGEIRTDRTGVGTKGVFGAQMRHDLTRGFPILTTKRLPFRWIAAELLWMLSGSTNVKPLQEAGVTIWDEWADPVTGDLGPIYGQQWRNWMGIRRVNTKEGGVVSSVLQEKHVDQIADLVRSLKANPDSRRHIVTAWNPADVPDMKLPPCHLLFQCYVSQGVNPRLSLHINMRSADIFLGVPFNIAFYALLTHILASICGYLPGELIVTFGDLHIYLNHMEQVKEQLLREPRKLPFLGFNREIDSLEGLCTSDFTLVGYDAHPTIKAPVAV